MTEKMKQCLRCNNMVPEGRALSVCDGCLALHYYGNALDTILNVTDPNTARSDYEVRQQVNRIALAAVKAVPRREPGPRFTVVMASEVAAHPHRSLSASDYVRAGEDDAAAIEAAYVEQGLGHVIDGIPNDLVRLPSFVRPGDLGAAVTQEVDRVLNAEWYEIEGHLFASAEAIDQPTGMTPEDLGIDMGTAEITHISADEGIKRFHWGDGYFFYK